jgi:hypothetical protein
MKTKIMNTHQIRIIATLEVLTRTWDAEWAQKHHAKTYTATITDGGWAQIDDAKFPPGSFEILPERPVKPVNINGEIISRSHNEIQAAQGIADVLRELGYDLNHETKTIELAK